MGNLASSNTSLKCNKKTIYQSARMYLFLVYNILDNQNQCFVVKEAGRSPTKIWQTPSKQFLDSLFKMQRKMNAHWTAGFNASFQGPAQTPGFNGRCVCVCARARRKITSRRLLAKALTLVPPSAHHDWVRACDQVSISNSGINTTGIAVRRFV